MKVEIGKSVKKKIGFDDGICSEETSVFGAVSEGMVMIEIS